MSASRAGRITAQHTWERVRRALLAEMQRQHRLDWSLCCVDGSSVRALTAAAGARKKTRHTRGRIRRREPRDHALGRSRGGWGSKLHVVCDRAGVVLAFRVTAGQVIECTECEALLHPSLRATDVTLWGEQLKPTRRPAQAYPFIRPR